MGTLAWDHRPVAAEAQRRKSEPLRVLRRLGDVSRASLTESLAGGRTPLRTPREECDKGSKRRRLLDQIDPGERGGLDLFGMSPRLSGPMTTVLLTPITDSARALSQESPTLPDRGLDAGRDERSV